MSAKDDFFKKVEENNKAEQAADNALKKDVATFQRETNELLETIKQWFQESGFQYDRRDEEVTDESRRPPFKFRVSAIVLTNGKKRLNIIPEGLYYFGGIKGCLIVSMTNQGHSKNLFELHMENGRANFDGWSIVDAASPEKAFEFNEENFFSRIKDFA